MSSPLPAPGEGMTHDNLCFGGGFLLLLLPEENEDEHDEEGDRASKIELWSFVSLVHDSRRVFDEFSMILSGTAFSTFSCINVFSVQGVDSNLECWSGRCSAVQSFEALEDSLISLSPSLKAGAAVVKSLYVP